MSKDRISAHKGWSFFWFTVVFGLILALLGVTVGFGASFRIPSTEWNLSFGGSVGKREVSEQALPGYLRNQIGANNTFINQSHTVTVWLAEGIGICVLGNQPQAPAADLSFSFNR